MKSKIRHVSFNLNKNTSLIYAYEPSLDTNSEEIKLRLSVSNGFVKRVKPLDREMAAFGALISVNAFEFRPGEEMTEGQKRFQLELLQEEDVESFKERPSFLVDRSLSDPPVKPLLPSQEDQVSPSTKRSAVKIDVQQTTFLRATAKTLLLKLTIFYFMWRTFSVLLRGVNSDDVSSFLLTQN